MQIVIYGNTIDDQGNPVKNETLRLNFDDVSAGLKSDINGLMGEFSEIYNDYFANEPSKTWTDL
jgi:hypothetical protein